MIRTALLVLLSLFATTYNYVLKAQDAKGNPLTSMAFAWTVGAANPATQTISIYDTSNCAMDIPCVFSGTTVKSDSAWLTVSPASGTTQFNVTVAINPAGLTTSQTGHIIVTQSQFTTSTLTIPVALTVTGSPHSVKLTWTASAVDANHPAATSYNVLRATGFPGTFSQVGSSTTTNFTDSTVQSKLNYCYQVQGVAAGSPSVMAQPAACFAIP